MQVIKEYIFPTVTHVFDNVLEPEYIDSMRDDIIQSSKINLEERKANWQSVKNPKLYENPKYKVLGEAALNLSKK